MKSTFLTFITVALCLKSVSAQEITSPFAASNAILHTLPKIESATVGSENSPAIKLGVEKSTNRLQQKVVYRVADGPWGNLEYYVIYLQAPQSWLQYLAIPSDRTVWSFKSDSTEEIIQLIDSVVAIEIDGLHWSQQGEFHQVPGESGISFLPTPKLITSLSAGERSKVARLLRVNKLNKDYTDPVVIESGDPVSWYREAGLSEEIVQLVASLCYLRGESTVFSDTPYILSQLETLDSKREFIRATSRTRSLVLRIRVGTSQEEQESISDYWTAGHKKKAILPILESISETPGVELLDVAHLLPPTPRKLLYTYPDLRDYLSIGERDCHWTSLNFFRVNPDGILPERAMAEMLMRDYTEVSGALKYGDMIVMKEAESNDVIHSAIYIAGDIVYTKNGRQRLSPWILMRYSDMERRYHLDNKITSLAFRLKDNL